jgi:DMSO/TMAO reductase YedYZ molybdopterin-dependent catalytic subunit
MADHRRTIPASLIAASLALAPAAARAGAVSSYFTLDGSVAAPGSYNITSLSALPPASLTATYLQAGHPVTDTYTGTTLWNLLQKGGLISPPGKNGILRDYVVAVGSDGYQAVVSLGEIDPSFGNRPDLVAYADTAHPGQLSGGGLDGFARLVLPGDSAGGRYVSNIVQLYAGTAPAVPGTPGAGISSQFTLSGEVQHPGTYTLSSLEALGATDGTTIMATYYQGSTKVTDTYTGITLWNLLTAAGIVTNPAIKNDILRDYVLVTGSDGYEAVFSMGEIDPAFGNQQDLVAYADTAGQLGGGSDGFARIVVPGDFLGGRYVSNITSIEVLNASVPEPASLSLVLLPLLGMAAVRARRLS